MKPEDFSKRMKASAAGALGDYLSQMDAARKAALGPVSRVQEIAEQLQAGSAALRFLEKDRERYDAMRRIVDPLRHVQEQFRASSWLEKLTSQAAAYQPMIDRIAQLGSVTRAVEEMRSQVSDYYTDVYLKTADTIPSIRSLDAVNRANIAAREWQVPPAIFSTLSSIDSIASSFEKLSQLSPAWAEAAKLASSLDDAVVDALGANASNDDAPTVLDVSDFQHAAFDQQSPDLVALASLILNFVMFLFLIQQAISGGRWQAAQAESNRQQLKTLQTISILLEKSVRAQDRRQHQVFVVKGRAARVRSGPYSRSAVLGKLVPGQSVKPIEEHGKWIEVEYFDRLTENYEAGWVLKKYLRRIYQISNPDDEAGN